MATNIYNLPSIIKLMGLILISFLTVGLGQSTHSQSFSAGQSHILIILDCSDSMKETVGKGQTRFDIARNIIKTYLSKYPKHKYALMAYGAGLSSGCRDLGLVASFTKDGGHKKVLEGLSRLRPYGATPLGQALKQGTKLLKDYPKPREIFLISDGADNCSNKFEDIAPLINKNNIHLKSVFLFLNDRDKKKIATLKAVRKRKSLRTGSSISYEKITTTLQPEKSRIPSFKKPRPKRVFKPVRFKRKVRKKKAERRRAVKRVFKKAHLKENQSLKPKYPFMAKRYEQEGKVTVGIRIDEEGQVEDVEVLKSSGYDLLDEAAMDTAKGWQYHPATLNDKATKDYKKMIIVFNLLDAE